MLLQVLMLLGIIVVLILGTAVTLLMLGMVILGVLDHVSHKPK